MKAIFMTFCIIMILLNVYNIFKNTTVKKYSYISIISILISLLLLSMTSCTPLDTIHNYPNSIILEITANGRDRRVIQLANPYDINKDKHRSRKYQVIKIEVSAEESKNFVVGDTIK